MSSRGKQGSTSSNSTSTGKRGSIKRTPEAIKLDRAETVRLLRRGWTKTAIAEKLGVHPTQISYDWKIIITEINAARDKDLEELIAIKLEEYGEIKRQAWEAWEKSKKERTKHTQEVSQGLDGSDRVKDITSREGGNYNGDHLRTILNCLSAERELLGLNPAKKIEGRISGTATIDWDKLAGAIPPSGTPLPDNVEDKIMGLLKSVNAQKPVVLDHNPTVIEHKPTS